ncbi:hypothetical protein HDU88_008193 [Geranomyces variabilis]|nr:hypothetical protein HDU88_008193 [Geranomyces variabilis]
MLSGGLVAGLTDLPVELLQRIAEFAMLSKDFRPPNLSAVGRLRSSCRRLACALPVNIPTAAFHHYTILARDNKDAIRKLWENERFATFDCTCDGLCPDESEWRPADDARAEPSATVCLWRLEFNPCDFELATALGSGSIDLLHVFEKAGLWELGILREAISQAAVPLGRDDAYIEEVAAVMSRVPFAIPTVSWVWIEACCVALRRRDFNLAEKFALNILAIAFEYEDHCRRHFETLSTFIYRAGWERGHDLLWDRCVMPLLPLRQPGRMESVNFHPLFGLAHGNHIRLAAKLVSSHDWESFDIAAGLAGAALSGNVGIAALYLDRLSSTSSIATIKALNTRLPFVMQGKFKFDGCHDNTFTPLEMACWQGHIHVAKVLTSCPSIKMGADRCAVVEDEDSIDYEKRPYTELPLAAGAGHADIVSHLISCGADLRGNMSDALVEALRANQLAIARVLINSGCNINELLMEDDGTIIEWTPLSVACAADHDDKPNIPAINFCRTHGAKPFMRDIHAILRCDKEFVPALDALSNPRWPCDGPLTIVPFSMHDLYEEHGIQAGKPWGTEDFNYWGLDRQQSQRSDSAGPVVNAVTLERGTAVIQKLLAIGADITIEGPLALSCAVSRILKDASDTNLHDSESVKKAEDRIAVVRLLVEAGVDLMVPVKIKGLDAQTGMQALRRAFTANEVEKMIYARRRRERALLMS